MKKIILGVLMTALLVGCSMLPTKGASKEQIQELSYRYALTNESAINWEETINNVLSEEALISDWYGEGTPAEYLRKTGKMDDSDYAFLSSLSGKMYFDVTEADFNKFVKLLTNYNNSLSRKFRLEDNNIKDPKGLASQIVKDSNSDLLTPAKHIKNSVATADEWKKLSYLAKKSSLNESDVKNVRAILNNFITRPNFFNEEAWISNQVSDEVLNLIEISNIPDKTDIMINNVNAKALKLIYGGYLSPMDKWKNK